MEFGALPSVRIGRPEEVGSYARAGVTRLIVAPWTRSREALDGLRRFADEILYPARASG
ncbi:hypothetical protein ACFY4C_33440 [Actinomadura viridis]|uniref:hypothetical protein n=1 Tax=Actinomadura viridis TaxID=58110 RepID=UPI0036B1A844